MIFVCGKNESLKQTADEENKNYLLRKVLKF